MTLADLEPKFVTTTDGRHIGKTDDFSRAQGVRFLCPQCFARNNGPVGTHMVLVWFADRGVPEAAKPLPRWGASGSGYADLTISPSIDLKDGDWHGFVTHGEVSVVGGEAR